MAKRRDFRILVASDGSPSARVALTVVTAFPWPRGTRVAAVVASREFVSSRGADWPPAVWMALQSAIERVRLGARRRLRRRWPTAEVAVVDQPPAAAILGEARRTGADVIVIGSRRLGALGRLVVGSVSRTVLRQATRPVLVVKGRPGPVRRFVLGLDGSRNARRAVRFLAAMAAPPGGQVSVVRVSELARVPSMGLAPASVRARVAEAVVELNARTVLAARRDVQAAARRLVGAGWRVRPVLRAGVPLTELLKAVRAARADVLVLGARGVGGIARLLLGSVAEGAVSHAPVSVLIVK